MSTSKLDAVYRSILLTKFFTKGWGKPENLRRLFEFRKVVSDREECLKLVERDYPVTITKEQTLSDCKLLEGYFKTPLERYLPGIVPEVAQKAYFQALLPLHWPDFNTKPVCLHMAGTGDHFFWRRRNLLVRPLLKEANIGGIILENPFYGLRKPTDQVRSSLHNVSDIFVMGGCLILEALVLFHWCERNGFGPLGVTGLSMGGHMASLAATNWPKPLVLVPCLSWSTASAVFLQGVMSQSINWDLLEDQYLSDGTYREKLSKMVTVVDEAFLAGKKFAKTFAQQVEQSKPITTQDNTNSSVDITFTENSDKTDNIKLKVDGKSKGKDLLKNKDELKENDIIETYKTKDSDKSLDICTDKQKEDLNAELKVLLENRISDGLYEKLTSNEKFELEAKDIEELNKVNEEKIKACVALKCKIGGISKRKWYSTNTSVENINKTNIKQDISENRIIVKEKPKIEKKTISNITADLWTKVPFMRAKEKKIDISKIHWRDREALQFMRGMMDECTHLSNFSVPYDTSLIIAVCAKHDAYVPREDVGTLEEIWPGAEVRYVDAGHVSAYILHQSMFRSCIIEAFERSKMKWNTGKEIF